MVEEENDLDTSKDEEDEDVNDEEDSSEATSLANLKIAPSKIYNCVDCTRMFMSAEAHANHLRDVHGGEGGSLVLKLPADKLAEKKKEERDTTEEGEDHMMILDNDDKAGDELFIDDSM